MENNTTPVQEENVKETAQEAKVTETAQAKPTKKHTRKGVN